MTTSMESNGISARDDRSVMQRIERLICDIQEASQQVISYGGKSQQERPPLPVWIQLMQQRGEWLTELNQSLGHVSEQLNNNETSHAVELNNQLKSIQAQDRLVQEVFQTHQSWIKQQLGQLKRNKKAVKHYKSEP